MDKHSFCKCGTCGCTVRADRLERHVQKQHSVEAERRKADAEKKAAEDRKRLKLLRDHQKLLKKREEIRARVEQFIRSNTDESRAICQFCGAVMSRKKLGKHVSKCHSGERPVSSFRLPVQRIPRTRREYLSKLFGPELPYSDDIFDKGLVSSGGAYGLGRNRRH